MVPVCGVLVEHVSVFRSERDGGGILMMLRGRYTNAGQKHGNDEGQPSHGEVLHFWVHLITTNTQPSAKTPPRQFGSTTWCSSGPARQMRHAP